MAERLPAEDVARRFLLGRLGEPEQSELEQQLIASSAAQERIALVESELVDDYVAGRLAPPDRARFERRYLTHAEGVSKVDLARLLRRRMIGPEGSRRSAWLPPWRAVAASLLVACLAGALSWQTWQAHRELEVKEAEIAAGQLRERELAERLRDAEARLGELRKEHLAERPAPALPSSRPADGTPELAVLLTPGALRDPASGTGTLAVSGSTPVRLELAWPVDVALTYRAVIQTPDQIEVWRAQGLPVHNRGTSTALVCRVPAGVLLPGDYIVRLHARERRGDWESVADYTFRASPAG